MARLSIPRSHCSELQGGRTMARVMSVHKVFCDIDRPSAQTSDGGTIRYHWPSSWLQDLFLDSSIIRHVGHRMSNTCEWGLQKELMKL